eukprot:5444231-Ditylum_brightwellii.AAC.1
MELPIGLNAPGGNPRTYVLHLNYYIYDLKQSSLNWCSLLSGAFKKKSHNATPSQTDPCLFICKDCILLIYVDEVLFIGKDNKAIDN